MLTCQVLRTSWKKLVKQAETRTDELSKRQARFKRGLIRDIRLFVEDVKHFRQDFLSNGPMVQVRAVPRPARGLMSEWQS